MPIAASCSPLRTHLTEHCLTRRQYYKSATCQQSRVSMRPLSTLRRSFLSHISKPVWYFAKRRVLLSDHRLPRPLPPPRILIMLTSACNEWYRVLFWYIIYKYVYNHQHYTWDYISRLSFLRIHMRIHTSLCAIRHIYCIYVQYCLF